MVEGEEFYGTVVTRLGHRYMLMPLVMRIAFCGDKVSGGSQYELNSVQLLNTETTFYSNPLGNFK